MLRFRSPMAMVIVLGSMTITFHAAFPQFDAGVASVAPGTGSLTLSLTEAVLRALEQNREINLRRLDRDVRKTFEDERLADFDPALGGELSHQRTRSQRLARTGTGTESSVQKVTRGEVFAEQFLPTGTSVALEGSSNRTESSLYSSPLISSRLGVTVTQSLLRGGSLSANLAALEQARLDSRIGDYEFRGYAESLVAHVEEAYWDLLLAERRIEIFEESLRLAEQQLIDTQARIAIGQLAEVELAAVQAELALRRENLINARGELALRKLILLRLVNPPGVDLGREDLVLTEQPALPEATGESVAMHVDVAMKMRPDLNQARLDLERGELEVVKTRNGLLPYLDAFITLGKTGYSDSFPESWRDLDGDSYDALTGVRFSYPLFNRAAKAKDRRARLNLQQAREALANLEQLAEVDVRAAYIEINRTREQIAAIEATRQFREETLRAETEKFRVGRSTNFLVARAQRDLVESQIDHIEAIAKHIKAWVVLYRLEGSLLERRGIEAPGRDAVADASRADSGS